MLIRQLRIVVFLGMLSTVAFSQAAVRDAGVRIDEILTRYTTYGFSGSVLVVKDNKTILNKAYGLADKDIGRANTTETLYDVGSIAKTFTAAAILKLETKGKLHTSDLISKYLGPMPPDKSGITIHHLLTHHGGVNADAADVGITPTSSRAEFFERFKTGPLLSVPGDKYNYSNLGYGLLAGIIENVTGDSWQSYVKKQLMKPAGLTKTVLYGHDFPANIAHGYTGGSEEDAKLEEPLRLERPDSMVWRKYTVGSVGVLTTTGDLHKWWTALRSDAVLTPVQRAQMFSVKAGNQGYGWNIQTINNEITRIHRGGLRGSYQSLVAHYPKQNTLLILAINKNVAEIGSGRWLTVVWNSLESIVQEKDSVIVPPAVLPRASVDPKPFVGDFELADGSRLSTWVENGALHLGATGQKAVDQLGWPGQTPPAYLPEVRDATTQLMDLLLVGDMTKINSLAIMPAAEVTNLQAKWKGWTDAVGGAKSYEVLGVSPGAGGNPRAFIKLQGENSTIVLRFLWNWGQKKLLAWGENINYPVILKMRPESKDTFINFDFEKSSLVRVTFSRGLDGSIKGLVILNDEPFILARIIRSN